jgi:WD40 repeat protein
MGCAPFPALRVWDLNGKTSTRVLEGHSGSVYGVALNGGGRRAVSCSVDKTVPEIWTGQIHMFLWEGSTGHMKD